MKPSKKKNTYIRNGIIYRGDEAIYAKEVSKAEKQVNDLKVVLENIAADSNSHSDPNGPNDIPTFSACNGEKDGLENLTDGGCDHKTIGKKSILSEKSKNLIKGNEIHAQVANLTICGNVLGNKKKVNISHDNFTKVNGEVQKVEMTAFDLDNSRNVIGTNNDVKINDQNKSIVNFSHRNIQASVVNQVAHDNVVGSYNKVDSERINMNLINSRVGNINMTGADLSASKNVIGDFNRVSNLEASLTGINIKRDIVNITGASASSKENVIGNFNRVSNLEASLTGINIERDIVNITGASASCKENVIGNGNIVTSARAKATLVNYQENITNIPVEGPDVSMKKNNIGRNLKLDGQAKFTGINIQKRNVDVRKNKDDKIKL
ncbi:916_t:CDS:2, partial [Racocetra fulgida]